MIPTNITREHVLHAIQEIDISGVPSSREQTKYSLVWNGKLYPPKYTISIANKYANQEELDPSAFSGGDETNPFLNKLDFTVIDISQWKENTLYLKEIYDARATNENLQNIINSKNEVLSKYQPLFSPNHIPQLTAEEFSEFLDFKNNKHWSNLQRQKGILTQDMERLKSALFILVDESLPVRERLDKIRPKNEPSMVQGIGEAISTAVLHIIGPDKYGVWNSTSREGLKKAGFYPILKKGATFGEQYRAINEVLIVISRELNVDLWTLDALWFDYVTSQGDDNEVEGKDAIEEDTPFSKKIILDAIAIADTIVKIGLADKKLSQSPDAKVNQEKYNSTIKPLLLEFRQRYGNTPNIILKGLLEEYAHKNHLLDEFEIQNFHFVGQKVNPYVWAAITPIDALDRKSRITFSTQLYVSIKPSSLEFGFSYGEKVKNEDPRVEIFRSNGFLQKNLLDILNSYPHIQIFERTAEKSDINVTPRFFQGDFKTWTNECFIVENISKENLPDDVKPRLFKTFNTLLSIFKFTTYANEKERLERFLQNKPTAEKIFEKANKNNDSIENKKQVILYGPPGTGKTYSSVIKAHEIIFGNKDDNITYRLLQEKLRKQQKSTIDLSQLTWIQAIILAFDEINKEKVQVDEIKNSKIIQDFISYKNSQYISNTIWALLQAESKLDSITVKLKNKSGREYFDKDTDSNWYLTEKGKEFQRNLIDDLKAHPETSDSQFSFITFHQSFSYEDFVEGIRPELNNADESSIVYRVKDGIFKEICKKALKDPGNNYVLVIDEINRGNISKIFGELITLLEDNKRIGEREEIIVRLPYSNESFGVPGNVYIIGTMNSTDKSIALVDIALRRRFHFERLKVDYELIQNNDAKTFLHELNSIICALKNADYEIGHYYFMHIPVEDTGNQALKQVFSNQILPLLEEYFFNDWEALATILGRDAITIETKKKFVWDEDSGKFEEETGDYDKIHGRCLKSLDSVFESAMNNLVTKKSTQERNP